MLQEQKRAWLNIGLGLVLGLSALGIVVFDGPELKNPLNWGDWEPTLSRVSTVCMFTAAAWFLGMFVTRRSPDEGEVVKDERDRLVAGKALAVQAWSVQALLFVWMVVLTETYIEEGGIPIAFPFLLWLSCSLAALMAHGLATLIWYRKLGS